jgi:hypothetical protein
MSFYSLVSDSSKRAASFDMNTIEITILFDYETYTKTSHYKRFMY